MSLGFAVLEILGPATKIAVLLTIFLSVLLLFFLLSIPVGLKFLNNVSKIFFKNYNGNRFHFSELGAAGPDISTTKDRSDKRTTPFDPECQNWFWYVRGNAIGAISDERGPKN